METTAQSVKSEQPKQGKKQMTLYWGVELKNDAFDHPDVKEHLNVNPDLIKLQKIHSTLLYVGKKIHPDEEQLRPFEGKKCKLTVDAFGHSDLACALSVKSIECCEEIDLVTIPSFAVKQHVTIALKLGTAAKDSVNTLLGEGNVIELKDELVLYGTVKRYMY